MTNSQPNKGDLTFVQRIQDEYLEGRLLASDLTREDVAAALTAFAHYFGIEWLQSSQSHPISKLWRSFDEISTQELFWLGDSIRVVSALNDRWVRDAVKKIKLPDSSRSGSVFELIMMAALRRRSGNQDIRPCPPMTEAIDAYGSVDDGTRVVISMKSFGASYKEKEFDKKSGDVLREIQGEAK